MNANSTAEGPKQNTSDAELRAIPQFDGVRWKLRVERIPRSPDMQFVGPVISTIAIGFTILSPMVCLTAAYLWAHVLG
jgi:hypothetical protein